jgi:hypothetical protein
VKNTLFTEEQFQNSCFIWFHNNFTAERGRLFAVDNNVSHRLPPQFRQIEGARKKGSGVVAGVSDFVFICENLVLFIELKLENGVQGPEQVKFQKLVESLGHIYVIIKPPLDNFQRLIHEFIH